MTYAGAGFILLSSDLMSLLLVKDARSGKWGFPKGHRESYDVSDLITAQRELYEETGINMRQYTVVDESFKIKKGSASYIFRYSIMTENERNVRITPGPRYEVGSVAWVPIQELLDATHILDANLYLRTWLEDFRSGIKRYIKLYKSLANCFEPVQVPMCPCYVVACA